MILTLLHLGWLSLKRDRVAQALTFLLPIIFFSIFASVFGEQGEPRTSRIRVAVVDEDQSEFSRRILAGLQEEDGLRVRTTAQDDGGGAALDRAAAERLVRNGGVPVAVVIPKGIGAAFADRGFAPGGPTVHLLADPSDPIAPQMVTGLLQKVTMTAAPDLMMRGGLNQFERHAGALTPQQRAAVDEWLPRLRQESSAQMGQAGAGHGVMFLLFSSVGGAGGVLLEEVESGTLERLLATRAGMTHLLVGKWLFLTLVGCAQLVIMFLWGRIAFDLPLFTHLPGFAVMTIVTAAAASALGLVLAALARTRAQLSGFSTILILTMSALGGSMFPRFLMSETMQKLGLLTFNGWALDGYLKVFWRHAAVWELWPQLLVLTGSCAVFLAAARLLARRWETA
jgi:ABC-2 type transport system permease protein